MTTMHFGTEKISPLYRYAANKKDLSEPEKSSLVSHIDITWNTFLPYLIELTNRLETIGFRYVDNEVIILEEETNVK